VKLEDVVFLEVEDVVLAHTKAIDRFGGSHGVRDHGLLESAVMAPRTGYYSSLAELAAVYLHGLAKNHAFVDGNERVAFAASVAFLRVQGVTLDLDADRWEEIVVGIASGSLDREQLALLFAAEIGDAGALE
jgi:death-on-curing protein